ncbi:MULTISPECIES: GOLPH3/VPS74 family protein [Streptomyces]|uniref:GOLPH3/VPS74 family protein n=1 Tax=Streptomyces arenae TaxID=29301 RepID=UPI001055C85D|nr:GPP34 family phosphoprotein [Streptomyces arenae]MCG7208376.1 GPP34 family phosphoprotein [Streptomyces arenae]
MTTPRDLFLVTVYDAAARPVEQGDLSLALAGAELADLIDAGAVTLDGDLVVPAPQGETGDRLLDEAAAALKREAPYESVEDWLWRRGRGLGAAYLDALEADGTVVARQPRRRWLPLPTGRTEPSDSPERAGAHERWTSGEPVLAALAAAVGVRDEAAKDLAGVAPDATVTVVAAVNDAVTELAAVRQRREIEDAAFDNVWRGL